MTIKDLHIAFKTGADKNEKAVAFGGCPAFTPEEIDQFLMQGYVEVLCNKFTGSNTRQEAFEGSVKRIADLERLVKTDNAVAVTFDSSSNVLTMSDFFKDSSNTNNRLFFVNAVLHFGNNQANVDLVDHKTADRFRKTYNNDPWIPTPKATIADNQLKIYIDTTSMKAPYTVDITYVKYPDKINYKEYNKDITEVPEYVLYEAVNRAVVIALENIESRRTETKLQINNLQE